MNTIFIVLAVVHHESSDPVKGFEDRAEADEFCDKCNAHHQAAPQMPRRANGCPYGMFEGSPEMKKWHVDIDAWRQAHPAGKEFTHCDVFEVKEIPFQPSTKKD